MLTIVLALAVGMVQRDWYMFEPDQKQFRVELPCKPNSTSSRSVSNAAGRSQITTAQLSTPTATYSLQVSETRAKVDPNTLDDGIKRYAATNKATLGIVSAITVDGNPAREFEMTERSDAGQKISKLRWIASGKSLYLLNVAGKPGAKLPADADRFLGSLEIGPAKSTVARSKAVEAEPAEVTKEDGPDTTKPTGKAASSKSAGPLKFTISRIPKNAKSYPPGDLADVSRSYVDKERDGFRDVGPEGSILVGVRVTYIERFGGPKIRSVQTIYRSGKSHYLGRIYGEVAGQELTFVAKPGYAVGGLVTHTGLTVDGFRMVYMKVDEDRLDRDDSYNSAWIGDVKGGSPGEVSSPGALVVGLQGRSGNEVFALGLTALK